MGHCWSYIPCLGYRPFVNCAKNSQLECIPICGDLQKSGTFEACINGVPEHGTAFMQASNSIGKIRHVSYKNPKTV